MTEYKAIGKYLAIVGLIVISLSIITIPNFIVFGTNYWDPTFFIIGMLIGIPLIVIGIFLFFRKHKST